MQTRAKEYPKSPMTMERPDGMVKDHSQRRVTNWLLSKEDQEVKPKEIPLCEPLPKQEPLQDSDEMSKNLDRSHMSNRSPSEKDTRVQPNLYELLHKQKPPQDSDASSEISYVASDITLISFSAPRPSREIKEMSDFSYDADNFSRWTGKAIIRLMNEISDLHRAPRVSLGADIESVLKNFKETKEEQLGQAACLAECVESEYEKIAITSISEFNPEALQLITYSSQDRIKTTSSYLHLKLNRYDLSGLLDISRGDLEEHVLHGLLERQIRYLRSELWDVFKEFKRSVKLMENAIEDDFNLLISCHNRFENFLPFVKFSQKRQEEIDKWIMKHHPREKSKRKNEKRKNEKRKNEKRKNEKRKRERAEREKRQNEQQERIATFWARVLPGRIPTLSLFLIFSLVHSLIYYYIHSSKDGLPANFY